MNACPTTHSAVRRAGDRLRASPSTPDTALRLSSSCDGFLAPMITLDTALFFRPPRGVLTTVARELAREETAGERTPHEQSSSPCSRDTASAFMSCHAASLERPARALPSIVSDSPVA